VAEAADRDRMLTLQALLITTSLLLIGGMVASTMWLAALRVPADREGVPVEPADTRLDSPA
jgi:hypothetical protein